MKIKKALIIGWTIVIISILLSWFVVLRGAIFEGQPVDSTSIVMTAIISGTLVTGYSIMTSVVTKGKNGSDKE